MRRFVRVLRQGTALIACALTACVTLPAQVAAELEAFSEAAAERTVFVADRAEPTAERAAGRVGVATAAPARTFDAAALPLASGQIVVSETGDAASLFFSLFTEDYAPWVHAGILAIEEGEPVVYDASGTLLPLPGLPPTATVSGAVRRVPLAQFVRGKRVVGFYLPPPVVDRDRLVAFAREHHARGTPFDPYFDAGDARAFYCTEFVAHALVAAGGEPVEPSPMRANASLAVVRGWLRIRAPRLILAGQLLAGAREVARWSPRLSPAQIDAYFAGKRALHARFDSHARLGDVFRWTGSGLALRADVRATFEAGLRRAAESEAAALP